MKKLQKFIELIGQALCTIMIKTNNMIEGSKQRDKSNENWSWVLESQDKQ